MWHVAERYVILASWLQRSRVETLESTHPRADKWMNRQSLKAACCVNTKAINKLQPFSGNFNIISVCISMQKEHLLKRMFETAQNPSPHSLSLKSHFDLITQLINM